MSFTKRLFSFIADSTRARQAFTEAHSALERLKTDKTDAEGDIKEIFNIHGFGREGEWKKLDGQCVQTDSGECVPLISSCHQVGWAYLDISFSYKTVIPMNCVSLARRGRYRSMVDQPLVLGVYLYVPLID